MTLAPPFDILFWLAVAVLATRGLFELAWTVRGLRRVALWAANRVQASLANMPGELIIDLDTAPLPVPMPVPVPVPVPIRAVDPEPEPEPAPLPVPAPEPVVHLGESLLDKISDEEIDHILRAPG